jgi:hypothetical protein
MLTVNSWASDLGYQLDFDYQGQGDDWYGHSGVDDYKTDYESQMAIGTLQGDDFCHGYIPEMVSMDERPETVRTNQSLTAYDFYFQGGSRCLANEEPPFDLIFEDGFE